MKRHSFRNSLRYRVAARTARFEPGAARAIELGLYVTYLTAEAIEYAFPRGRVEYIALLSAGDVIEVHSDEVQISDAPCEPIPMMESVAVLPLHTSFFEVAAISENLFRPLERHRMGGKTYGEEHAEQSQAELFPGGSQEANNLERIGGFRKSFRQVNRSTRKGPTVWDLLLPLLQPPVAQAFTDLLELPPRCSPHPYQWEGIQFLVARGAALLADDMGTGKTVQSILASRLLFQKREVQRALFVCPLSVLPHWDREFERWAPSLKVTVVRGTREHRELCWEMPAHVWITTYDTLRQDIDLIEERGLHKFDLAVLDEAQHIKNRDRGRSKAARKLHVQRKWVLTGTPVETKLEELAAIFAFLKPGVFPNREVSPDEAKRLIKDYFLRRRKEDVLKDLPEKEEYPVPLHLSEEQQSTYDQMEHERVVELHKQGKRITAFNILTLIQELKKICNRDPRTGESVKLEWLLDNIEEMTEDGNKALIFCQYREEQFGGTDWLHRELMDYGALNYADADTDRKRAAILSRFKEDTTARVFIGNPRTAGVGLNELVAANYVVHFDHWWNPAVTNQATDRAHRPGQTRPVVVYHFWVEDTIEEQLILQKTLARQRLYDEVVDSLSTQPPEEVLFDVYDDLLKKHGFTPLGLGKRSRSAVTPKHGGTDVELIRSPRDLEIMVGRLYDVMGYKTVVTPYSHDGGIDVVAKREIGYSVEKIAIQCKHQADSVGVQPLRDLLGVVSADPSFTKGVLITTSGLTASADQFLKSNGRLQAITGPELAVLLNKYHVASLPHD
jgi:superfamily II DNA or RNA helicase